MGWWQDVKDTYNYHKDLQAHQQRAKNLMAELKRIESSGGDYQAREQEMLRFRNQNAEAFTASEPKPPATTSWWGNLFGRRNFNTVQTPQEQAAYSDAKQQFSDHRIDKQYRNAGIEQSINRSNAINAGTAVRNSYMESKISSIGVMQAELNTRSDLYTSATGAAKNSSVYLERLGPMAMDPKASVAENRARKADMLEYGNLLTSRATNQEVDAKRFQELTTKVAGYLRPAVDAIKNFDATNAHIDNVAWVNDEKMTQMGLATKSYMTLSDLAKSDNSRELTAALMGTPSEAQDIVDKGWMMDIMQRGVRGTMIRNMGDSLTAEDLPKFRMPNVNTEKSNSVSGLQQLLSSYTQKPYPIGPGFNEDKKLGIPGSDVKTFADMQAVLATDTERRAWTKPKVIDVNELGQTLGVAPNEPTTNQKTTTQATKQASKTVGMGGK